MSRVFLSCGGVCSRWIVRRLVYFILTIFVCCDVVFFGFRLRQEGTIA